MAEAAGLIYLAGVLVGLARIDGRWPARLGLALVWPLGPLAFVLTISLLLLASLVAFPLVGALVLGSIVLVVLFFL